MSKKSMSPSNARRFVGGAAYGLFLAMALGVGTFFGWVTQSATFTGIVMGAIFKPKPPAETFKSDSLTLLILGCDEDYSADGKRIVKKQARSDMMLIAKLDFKKNMITGVSIPRDTECNLPGFHKGNKINAYHNYAKKGHEAELTQKAVEFLLPGVKIDRVVTLDFDAFQQVVNLVGGVPIDNEKALDYDDNAGNLHIHLKKGLQLMQGYDAMCFVRFRHGDNDFVRQKRQKQFLLAFKNQALKDWIQVPTIIEKSLGIVGNAFTSDEAASLALFSKNVPPQNIDWGQIPVREVSGEPNVFLNKKELPGVLAHYGLIDTPVASTDNKPGDQG